MSSPRPASTVVLLRQGEVPEVFLVRRHGASGFMAGATVFPGGKVDDADFDVEVEGRSADECAAALGMSDPGVATAYFVAAVRELHEEAQVVLARDAEGRFPTGERLEELNRSLRALRSGHRVRAVDVHALWRSHGLRPALDRIHPFAWWVTPSAEPKRFDTRFFVARLPAGQRAHMDGFETTAEHWLDARAAVDAHDQSTEIYLPPPTLHTLERLAELAGDAESVEQALAAVGCGPRIEPFFCRDGQGAPVIALPDDPLHPQSAHEPPRRNRFVLRDGRFRHESQGTDLI